MSIIEEMGMKYVPKGLMFLSILCTFWLTACQSSNAPAANTATDGRKSLAPERVDIRGSIIVSRYNQGQVVLEVEGLPSQNSRYDRAYVLVLPTTQIIGPDGQSISLSELSMGQNVAILLRSGGKGNFVGVGVARKVWVEERY